MAAAVLAVAATTACRIDMHLDPKLEPLTRSDFYDDGRASRSPVPNTVARGQLRADTYLYSGMINGQPGDVLPFPATREVLERGRERFNIYCSPCHSRLGDGNGMIVQRGYRRPPSYYSPALLKAPIGHFYDVMTNGFGAMPDYAAQVSPHDRWAIAAYIRVLQLSQRSPASNLPPGQQVFLTAPISSAVGSELPLPKAAQQPPAERKPR